MKISYFESEHKILHFILETWIPFTDGLLTSDRPDIICKPYKSKKDFWIFITELNTKYKNDNRTLYICKNSLRENQYGIKLL